MSNSKVFVDTGGWIACLCKGDKYHKAAISYLRELREKQIPLITSNYIIDETLTWLSYNSYNDIALKVMDLWNEAEETQSLEIYWIDRDICKKAWEIYCHYSEHKLSFTDCTSFAICKKTNTQKVFGFDKHFNIPGFLLSPYQIKEDRVEYDVLRP